MLGEEQMKPKQLEPSQLEPKQLEPKQLEPSPMESPPAACEGAEDAAGLAQLWAADPLQMVSRDSSVTNWLSLSR